MWTGGAVALYDFVKASPGMAIRHQRVDKFYKENSGFNKKPGLFSQGSTGLQEYEATEKSEEDKKESQPGTTSRRIINQDLKRLLVKTWGLF